MLERLDLTDNLAAPAVELEEIVQGVALVLVGDGGADVVHMVTDEFQIKHGLSL